ncbi:MAG: hypothetical protein EI684_15305 [Candidatus Viridilinea halotolerans]|uniref:Uncharacterized protein n=1 Tax=Candidatus Viridilinea halotolerans TaxID=2491704 RepID=A0A426TVU1_9CHLR|nr:MAG: hypothetical protein EI684_15305 [Candidatus Viridilinea halotolerans]
MTVTAALLTRLRRLVAEPTDATYPDATLHQHLEATVVTERATVAVGRRGAHGTVAHVRYTPQPVVYDIHAAAAAIWEEKLAALIGAGTYDYQADGQSFHLGQMVQQYQQRVSYHLARRRVKSVRMVPKPIRATDEEEHL